MSTVTIEIEVLELQGFDPAHRLAISTALTDELQRLVERRVEAWRPLQTRATEAALVPSADHGSPASTGAAIARSVYTTLVDQRSTLPGFGH